MKLNERECKILLASVIDSMATLSNNQDTSMDDMLIVCELYVKLASEFKKQELRSGWNKVTR